MRNHLVGRACVDSRPSRSFEGVNEVLDDTIYLQVARLMRMLDSE